MTGYLALILHAHLPFVRHPEHERFLEETWLFEAITETYIPLLQTIQGWRAQRLPAPLTLTLTPTLCSMLQDPLLQTRYERHLDELIGLAEKEIYRTHWEKPLNTLATFYHERFRSLRKFYLACGKNLIDVFRNLQDSGNIEIITSAATHALLPFLAQHPPSLRAQILVGRDHYVSCFGREPRGIWLPECAYVEEVESALQEANIRWFILDTHGVLRGQPRPRYGMFAPVFTPKGLAAFGRDLESARQVWSRHEGYPGDGRYRDFYRDIGFELDWDYVKPHMAAPEQRGFTGLKYHRITGATPHKEPYERRAALSVADEHARHFLQARVSQIEKLGQILQRPPLIVAPYDAELFGHWWYEGPEFLDFFVRKACGTQNAFSLVTPQTYLEQNPTQQVAQPSASSWGEEGHWRVWLNETNEWIYPHLQMAQSRMTELAHRFASPEPLQLRALKQAGRELLLAQSSDWPFILRTGTSPGYARRRFEGHLLRFSRLYEQLTVGKIDESSLAKIEATDNIFPGVDYTYWR